MNDDRLHVDDALRWRRAAVVVVPAVVAAAAAAARSERAAETASHVVAREANGDAHGRTGGGGWKICTGYCGA